MSGSLPPEGGVHITAVVAYRDRVDGRDAMLSINVWPLPVDDALATELFYTAMAAINAKLTERGLTDGNLTDHLSPGVRH